MSYREVRSFCEMMRSLGYNRVISMENFRSPNFQLVSELLYWLLKRYDPETAIQDDIDNIPERVRFLQEIAQTMLIKARVKLNIKRLYAADGRAVKELLKVASLLYKASHTAGQDAEEMAVETSEALVELGALEVQNTRTMIAEITKAGSAIYEGLALERELKEARRVAIAKNADKADVDRTIQEAVDQLVDEEERLEATLEDLRAQNAENSEKLKRKRAEFERMEKRLAALKQVRPAYQKDLDELEAQLQGLYSQYLNRFRTLEYLQHEIEKIHRQEQDQMALQEGKVDKMRRKIAMDEMKLLRGQTAVQESDLMAEFRDLDDSDDGSEIDLRQPASKIMYDRPNAAEGRGRAQGSLMAVADDDEGTDEDELANEASDDVEMFEARRNMPVGKSPAPKAQGLGGRPHAGKGVPKQPVPQDDFEDDGIDDIDDDF